MNDDFNPYQPPTTNIIQTHPNGEYWAEGKFLVMPYTKEQRILPHRCIYCNKPIEELKKRIFYWHHPLFLLLILLNLLIYLIVALFIRKKVTLHIGICNEHKRKRLLKSLATLAVIFINIFLMFTFSNYMLIGFPVLLIGLIFLVIISNPLSISKIKNDLVYFRKCGRPFLDSLN